jgi:hypothetical protein
VADACLLGWTFHWGRTLSFPDIIQSNEHSFTDSPGGHNRILRKYSKMGLGGRGSLRGWRKAAWGGQEHSKQRHSPSISHSNRNLQIILEGFKVYFANNCEVYTEWLRLWANVNRLEFLFLSFFLFAVLGIQSQTMCLLGKHSTTWATPPAL